MLRSTAALLAEVGYDVVTHDAAAGIAEAAVAHRAEVLLQDVRMPGLDLERLMTSLRGLPELSSLRVILFTASMDLGDVADRLGVKWTLEKPFKPADLFDAIELACQEQPALAPRHLSG